MVIGLCGSAGSGKSTVGGILQNFLEFELIAFSDPIYAAVSAATGVSIRNLRDRSKKEKAIDGVGKSPRQLMQTLGTEWGRDYVNKNIWIDQAVKKCKQFCDEGKNVVIVDVRFENEVNAIKQFDNSHIWKVESSFKSRKGTPHVHSSEIGISPDSIDKVIENNESIFELSMMVLCYATSMRC